MKKLLVAAVLSILSLSVHSADQRWVEVNDNTTSTVYVDMGT